jgi:hypothetical protein
MDLTRLLWQKKDAVLNRWFDLIVETYPALSRIFLKKNSPIGNPAGVNMAHALGGLYADLLDQGTTDKTEVYIDEIIRIRAVQEFKPSDATAVIFMLKNAIRQELASELNSVDMLLELLDLELKIDTLARLAFDMHSGCREQLFQMRVDEVKRRVSGLLRRHNLKVDYPDQGPGPEKG